MTTLVGFSSGLWMFSPICGSRRTMAMPSAASFICTMWRPNHQRGNVRKMSFCEAAK